LKGMDIRNDLTCFCCSRDNLQRLLVQLNSGNICSVEDSPI
jgi:hypothetical protein